jgi:hypothetical protein
MRFNAAQRGAAATLRAANNGVVPRPGGGGLNRAQRNTRALGAAARASQGLSPY